MTSSLRGKKKMWQGMLLDSKLLIKTKAERDPSILWTAYMKSLIDDDGGRRKRKMRKSRNTVD